MVTEKNTKDYLAVSIAHKAMATLNPWGRPNLHTALKDNEFSFRPLGFKLSDGYTLVVQLMRENSLGSVPMHDVHIKRTENGEFIFALTGPQYDNLDALKETVTSVLDNVPGGELSPGCIIEEVDFCEPMCRYLLMQYNDANVAQKVFSSYEDAAEKMRERFSEVAVAEKLLPEDQAESLKKYCGMDYQFLNMGSNGTYGIDRTCAFAGTTWWAIFCLPDGQASGNLSMGAYKDATQDGEPEWAFVAKLLREKRQEINIRKMLTLSAEHISGETAAMLNENGETNALPLSVYVKSTFGWYICFSKGAQLNCIPDDLAQCVRFAQTCDCNMICFDSDETPISTLPTYDWDACEQAPQLD